MKLLLACLLFSASAFAVDNEWNLRVKYGTAGAPPFDQSATELPRHVTAAIEFKARDPYIIVKSWTQPEIYKINAETKAWRFKVTTQYRDYWVFVTKAHTDAY